MARIFTDADDRALIARLRLLTNAQILVLIAFSSIYRRHDLIALVDKITASN